jgi:hypothetical protein
MALDYSSGALAVMENTTVAGRKAGTGAMSTAASRTSFEATA